MALWNWADPVLAGSGARLLTAGLCSGNVEWPGRYRWMLSPAPDGLAVHPYGKNAVQAF